MNRIVGRLTEQEVLAKVVNSSEAEFVAVYGRRRVGKTYLISEYFQAQKTYFELTGIQQGSLRDQLDNFVDAVTRSSLTNLTIARPASWADAFRQLIGLLEGRTEQGPKVLFFDELPWLASRKSKFLQALGHFWNTWASRRNDIIVIVCGSAASWMLDKVINNRGGLHNRITRRIRLMPFSLGETEDFLRYRKVSLNRRQILEIFMVTGGIPQYLKQIERGKSAAQNIDALCFSKDGFLTDEFGRLYESLFQHAQSHVDVVRALARKRAGLSRTELLEKAGLPSGGTSTRILTALEESGFIARHVPFGKKKNSAQYRLIDEFSLFYLTWMEPGTHDLARSNWLQLRQSRAWSAWAAITFEGVCWKHVDRIAHGLSIGGVNTVASVWSYRACDKNQRGAQIDLLIDRADYCISVCEIKFSDTMFTITKSYAAELQAKLDVFRQQSGSRKTLFLVMIASSGCSENEHYQRLITSQLNLDDLF
jgi:AAA+ ATPase superfamily predicted ATPase